MSNVQQALQKAAFGILKSCDTLVSTNSPSVDKAGFLQPNVDVIALIGHAVSELSRLRWEQIKPALKPKFYSLCSTANESSNQSALLFGTDLAKAIRVAKDASNIGKKIGSGDKNDAQRNSRQFYRFFDKRKPQKEYSSGTYKQPFLGKHQKKPNYKKYQADKK